MSQFGSADYMLIYTVGVHAYVRKRCLGACPQRVGSTCNTCIPVAATNTITQQRENEGKVRVLDEEKNTLRQICVFSDLEWFICLPCLVSYTDYLITILTCVTIATHN